MSERLSRIGARLGNWNDARFAGDTKFDHRWPWRFLDRVSAWLYTMPDRSARSVGDGEKEGRK